MARLGKHPLVALSAALSGCGTDQSASHPFLNCSVNIAFDGNSLTYGSLNPTTHVSEPYPSQLAALPPMAGSGTSGGESTNFGVGGSTWSDMTARAPAGLDTAVVLGRTNLLIAWETINTVAAVWLDGYGTSSLANYVALNATGCESYVAARRAAGWDMIFLLGSLPHERFLFIPPLNEVLAACDEDMRARLYGADAYIDLRHNGPFDFTANGWTFDIGTYPGGPLTDSGFDQLAYIYGDGGLWLPAAIQPPGTRVHLSNGGYSIIAERVGEALSCLD
jgi:hypothetical protein